MSPRKESIMKTILTGVAITLLSGILVAAYSAKEDVSAHTIDQTRTNESMQRVLDMLCEDHPTKRQCK